MYKVKIGKIVQISGPVIDVEFEDGHLPKIKEALSVTLDGKERIMEVYLNSIEMGEGIYGAEAVAQLHFGTTAAELTRAQCALIAATLPNPLRYDSAHPSRYMLKRQRKIIREMRHIPLFHYPEEAKA